MFIQRKLSKLHCLADHGDVTPHFVVNPLVPEDLESPHLNEFEKQCEESIEKKHLI